MIIKVPFKTPSVNHLYGQRGFRKYLTKEAKKLREEIDKIVKSHPYSDKQDLKDKPLKVVVYLYEDWYCLNGSVKRVDVDNRAKFLLDSVFNALGIDDRHIFELTMIKTTSLNDNENHAIIEIEPL